MQWYLKYSSLIYDLLLTHTLEKKVPAGALLNDFLSREISVWTANHSLITTVLMIKFIMLAISSIVLLLSLLVTGRGSTVLSNLRTDIFLCIKYYHSVLGWLSGSVDKKMSVLSLCIRMTIWFRKKSSLKIHMGQIIT